MARRVEKELAESEMADGGIVCSPADIQFWISDDGTKNGLWARQTRINIHTVFAAP